MAGIVGFLIALVILALVLWIISLILPSFGLPANIQKAVLGILALIFLLWLLGGGGLSYFHFPLWR